MRCKERTIDSGERWVSVRLKNFLDRDEGMENTVLHWNTTVFGVTSLNSSFTCLDLC